MSMEKRVEIGESVNADPIRNGLPTNVKTEFGAGHPVEELINTVRVGEKMEGKGGENHVGDV